MKNLIVNGDFATQQLAPWTTNAIHDPVFEPAKPGGYSLKLEPNTEIQQQLETRESGDYLLDWTFSARIDAKAHLGGALFVMFSSRVGDEFYLDTSYTAQLTEQWQTFTYQGIQPFPARHESLYIQIINARKVDEQGPASAPVQVTGICVSTRAA